MGRLTSIDSNGCPVYLGRFRQHNDDVAAEMTPEAVREVLMKLTLYECAGLEPEDVFKMTGKTMGRVYDLNKVNKLRECRYSDTTLMNWKKDELIEYIRTLEHNYDVAIRFNEQQARNIEKVLSDEWMPIDKPPMPGMRVQVTDGYWVGEAYVNHNGVWMRYDSTPIEVTLGFKITHWAPLKKSPKEMEDARRGDDT